MRAGLVLVIAACSAAARPSPAPGVAVPPAPPECRHVAPGDALRAAAAVPGAVLCLGRGRHAGPIAIAPGAVVWGPGDAVIERPSGGTVVELAAGAALLGTTIDGRGGVFDRTDAGVKLIGDGARLEGAAIVHAVFGVLAERVARVAIRGNRIDGGRDPAIGLRGDAIRLWEVQDSAVEANRVDGGRDIVVWYSSRNRLANNQVAGARYGTHLMYSHHNRITDNRFDGNVVGVFVMYSHEVALERNVVVAARGAAGMAIGLKDSGNVALTGNLVIGGHTGLYIDQTPVQLAHRLTIEGNRFARCTAAIRFHASGHRTTVQGNDFLGDGPAVTIAGGGEASDVSWRGNHFAGYTGYDLDGDGTGDIAYQLHSFEDDLTGQRPALAFFHGTPALDAADAVTRLVPLYHRRTLLADPAPRMRPQPWQDSDAD